VTVLPADRYNKRLYLVAVPRTSKNDEFQEVVRMFEGVCERQDAQFIVFYQGVVQFEARLPVFGRFLLPFFGRLCAWTAARKAGKELKVPE
jgi:hypothetical protein